MNKIINDIKGKVSNFENNFSNYILKSNLFSDYTKLQQNYYQNKVDNNNDMQKELLTVRQKIRKIDNLIDGYYNKNIKNQSIIKMLLYVILVLVIVFTLQSYYYYYKLGEI